MCMYTKDMYVFMCVHVYTHVMDRSVSMHSGVDFVASVCVRACALLTLNHTCMYFLVVAGDAGNS